MFFFRKLNRTRIWQFWGGLDALYLLWYVSSTARLGKVPFWDDLAVATEVLKEHGTAALVMVMINWGLQLSIVVSAFLFLFQRKEAKWLGLAQIPLRLVFVVPSFSVLLIGAYFFPGYNPLMMLGVIVLSEIIKGWSLCAIRNDPR
ncbi:hypothetical protein RBU55_26345 [Pseudomonas chlororaphis subsp. aurantiaca]|uniref:hypothetical protein n=1 Tax=Pseudomonas chlororaphis TaxID=587753 RepID=UPI001CF11830|nr:hypothetical protein [Pseudomonas chlororaphis]UCR82758.1 hypothetical protein K9V45_21295 [Pseudomonas chlororaphis]WMI99033.1 hypothetical protein RBU55_26345 [Pseudomonas chlororaphis subsp. aurantiaca]